MIQADQLSIAFQGESLFQNLSFSIQSGEKCALIGRNGSGKTTLLRILIGQETPDSGKITFSKGYKLGYLQQHIHFEHPTVLKEAMSIFPKELQEETYRAGTILFGLGFDDEKLELSPSKLSGGFSLRLNLAKVLLSDPDCLLLDEPTNYLDLPAIRWLVRFLRGWRKELILISHDREFLDQIVTHTMGIHRNQLYKIKGKTLDLFELIAQKEEIHERTREKNEKMKAHAKVFIDRFGAKATKAAQARSRQKMIDRIPSLEKLAEIYQLKFSFREAPFQSQKMIQANLLNFAYPNSEKTLISDFSFVIENHKRIGIIGKNGLGKSTLLRLLAQDLKPQSGTLVQNEKTSIGYFGQTNIQRLNPDLTIQEEIAEANPDLNLTEVRSICGQMMFSKNQADKKIKVLSGGEKSRVLLGKILAKKCNLLFLDEPTHHLDIESIEALIDALEEFEGSVVIVTHSELILERLNLDSIVLCHQKGQQIFEGTYEEFLEKVGWPEEEKPQKAKKAEVPRPSSNLKPLQAKIEKLEKEIFVLEQKLEKTKEEMVGLVAKKMSVQHLVKNIEEDEKRLEKLYAEWELMTSALEEEKKKNP